LIKTDLLLEDYVKKELEINERIILENEDFVALVPFCLALRNDDCEQKKD
jgi:galactose-1-phosphate uridylyltransferase